MKNSKNNINPAVFDNLARRGAVPIQPHDQIAQDAINAQVADIFMKATLFDSLYHAFVNWALGNDWQVGMTPDKRIWMAKHQSTGKMSPQFGSIGDLFRWLNQEIND